MDELYAERRTDLPTTLSGGQLAGRLPHFPAGLAHVLDAEAEGCEIIEVVTRRGLHARVSFEQYALACEVARELIIFLRIIIDFVWRGGFLAPLKENCGSRVRTLPSRRVVCGRVDCADGCHLRVAITGSRQYAHSSTGRCMVIVRPELRAIREAMKRPARAIPFLRSVRAKLLLMLGFLSLPLLITSLVQLRNYHRNLNEQAATIVGMEASSAAGALRSWLETHTAHASQSNAMTPAEMDDLYKHLEQQSSFSEGSILVVYDPQGRVIQNPDMRGGPLPLSIKFVPEPTALKWSDGVSRLTSIRHVGAQGWAVVVGVPLVENTLAGRSALALAAAWALALIASIFIAVWAVGRFTKPLRKLTASASMLGEGQLQERIKVETEDEVGALAGSFNVMASQLETKFGELQTQGAFIEDVLDGLPFGVAVVDSQLTVRKANPAFARSVGCDACDLEGRGLYQAAAGFTVLSDVVEDVRRTRRAFVTYGLPLDLVARNREAAEETGEASYWDVTIWPTTPRSAVRGDLIFILAEVTKRVRAEKLATASFANERARAAELESIINQMNEGVVIIDRKRRYKINPAAAEIIGRRRSDLRDGAQALIDDIAFRDLEDRKLSSEATPLWRALELREEVSGEKLKITRPDGADRVVTISATPLVGEGGKQEGAVAVFRDITVEEAQHVELAAAYERLREHDRLKSAFVSNMTHELRTPLNVIIGLCQILSRDRQLPLAPLQQEAVSRMQRNARSLLEIVNDLLDYSRLEAGRSALHLEKVNVADLVKEIVADYAAETKEKRIEIRANVAPELDAVLTDRYKLSQVLSNLLGNAVKFTTAGAVTVTAAPLDADRWYMEVSDTGIGISRDALSYIFDEFRQVDDRLTRAYGGTGLGLALTRKIVELLGGEISVESKVDEGSRFRIVWPRAVRQRTGTGSLVEKEVPAPTESNVLRPRRFANGK